ncbi:acyl-CoA dehydrogenase family protein [Tsukamurella pseudospumae]|uniref:Acyl-CoA dehydrogenase n=1 Tax=Tsukamurella pseudospumae TaxID=239498 RepID=A0A138AIS1_9ACTN|nr:acyl-CoA dehydrogenase family protein [Tsukamurella pseudospumae]KXO98435.1 acyl-CoA dehydrogenase [Tsukamurella pseudospumae]KXP10247.1 acyl-CoA dehydrogenase [Tsukamurella pseudospumae]
MRFVPSQENQDFASSLDDLLSSADVVAAARAWAAGDAGPGHRIWGALARLGVPALAVPEEHGGVGGDPADLAVAFQRLGYHGVPGPVVESIAVLPVLLGADSPHLAALAEGAIGTVALAPRTPFLLDADVADLRFVAGVDGSMTEVPAPSTEPLGSIDRTRRLFHPQLNTVTEGEPAGRILHNGVQSGEVAGAFAVAAQLLGAGRRLLDDTVEYAKARSQYGKAIGEYQAIKHLLADVATRLELAAPLLHGAAVALSGAASRGVDLDPVRDVSAARVAAADAAYLAARTALQVHGAIGYTAEHDLGLWITKVRALQSAWGTQAEHRAVVLDAVRKAAR